MTPANGQQHQIAVTCPCGEQFKTRMPEGDWVNSLKASLFVATHERPFKCPRCGQVYVAVITAGNIMWGATPISPEQAATLEVSRVLRPV